MQTLNNIAFKEWAVVCAALANGRQSLILRKGGVHEGREGFRVQHREFWLLQTRFHQDSNEIVPDALQLWHASQQDAPQPGILRIEHYAVVHDVFEIRDPSKLAKLRSHHILSESTLEQRFHYRQPGLFALAVRIFRLAKLLEIAETPQIAGCKSWVELPSNLPTEELRPTLDDAAFARQLEIVRAALT